MHVFVTTKKVAQFLQAEDARSCLVEFGARSRKALLRIVFSERYDVQVRRGAIEALVELGIMPNTERKLDCTSEKCLSLDTRLKAFADDLKAVPTDLRQYLIQSCCTSAASTDTKNFLLALFSMPKLVYHKEIAECIRDHAGEEFLSIASSGLGNEQAYEAFRVGCMEALMIMRPPDIIPVLRTTLGKATMGYRDYLIDRVVDALTKLRAEGRALEKVLIAKLQEANRGDAHRSLHAVFNRGICRDEYGWTLSPSERILKLLGNMGGEFALRSMARMFMGLSGAITNTEAIQTLDAGSQALVVKSGTQESALFAGNVAESIMEVYKRLREAGTISSADDVEELGELMGTHGELPVDASEHSTDSLGHLTRFLAHRLKIYGNPTSDTATESHDC